MSNANALALARDLDAALTALLNAGLSAPLVSGFPSHDLDHAQRLVGRLRNSAVAHSGTEIPARLDIVSATIPGGTPQWGWQITRGADILAFCERPFSTSTEARDDGLGHADERGIDLAVIALVPATALERRFALAA